MEDELDAVIASNNMRECRHCKCSGFQTSDECAEHEIMCRENGVLRAKVEAQEKEIAALKKAQVEDKDHYERHLSGALDDRDNRIDEIDRLEKSVRQLIGFYRIEYKSAHNGELPDAEFNLAEQEAEAALSESPAASLAAVRAEVWESMVSAPKDGSEFLIRYPLQGNCLSLCRWDMIHKQWLEKGRAIFPETQGCEWVAIPGAKARALRESGKDARRGEEG